jgi:hypothetical protein
MLRVGGTRFRVGISERLRRPVRPDVVGVRGSPVPLSAGTLLRMSTGPRPFDRLSAVGGVYDICAPETPRYLGSCAALGLPTHFVTAAHCVIGRDRRSLAVNHFGIRRNPFSAVRRCSVYESCDVAVLEAEVERPTWIAPFTKVRGFTYMGEPVTAIGSPVGYLTEGQQESPRVFRGFVQRPFAYDGRLGHRYSAYELSFPSPPGLSGAPLFADREPNFLLGVITENFKSYTVVESEEITSGGGGLRRTESREIVTYGVAANPFHALDFLENAIPVGNLNAAESEDDSGRT